MAAKAQPTDWICCTPPNWSRTAELSPPKRVSPQVTTDPSARSCTPPSWSWSAALSPPWSPQPQVTTDPSARMAAKACSVAWICCTPWAAPDLELPNCLRGLMRSVLRNYRQNLALPVAFQHRARHQPTKELSARMAAKAQPADWICCTPLSWPRTAELSPPSSASPQVKMALSPWHHSAKALFVAANCGWSTRAARHSPSSISASSKACSNSTRTRFLAVISLRCFFLKARWAFVLTSWTMEEGRSAKSSACPFGKATFIRSIELRRPQNLNDSSNDQQCIPYLSHII